MNIKVCGITQLKQLQQLEAMDIDFAGLIFYEKSPRYMGNAIPAKELKTADFDVRKVGVFVDAEFDTIVKNIKAYGLDLVQLHGNESPELCEDLSDETEVIKVFSIDEAAKNIDALVADYDAVCDYYLFDTKQGDKAGGTGKKFDWQLLAKAKIEKPFFLSGGIGLDDVTAIKAFKHPDFFGVDINSRFEKEPGVKDIAEILKFKVSLNVK